jgi:hypothetical protein
MLAMAGVAPFWTMAQGTDTAEKPRLERDKRRFDADGSVKRFEMLS